MKLSIKKITLIVSLLIVIIFSYQLYWLYGLYSSTVTKTEKIIKESLPITDHEELFMRLKTIDISESDTSDVEMNISRNLGKDSLGDESYFSEDSSEQQVDTLQESQEENEFSLLEKNIRDNEALNSYLHKALHSTFDTLIPINISTFDSILVSKLKAQNIDIKHHLVLLNDSTVATDSIKTLESKYSKYYNYFYELDNGNFIRLYTQNPAHQALQQMIGILSTSIIIFFLLLYIFIYLIRVIQKLQTEEELKTNFTNNMTHELKTPIAVSYAAVDALLISDSTPSPERQKKYLNIAKSQMNQLSGLVEQILSMSRKNNKEIDLKKETLDLTDIVNEVSEKQKLVHKKKIEINTNFEALTINADKLHLTNIFNNLIENSIKYSGDSVKIDIESRINHHQIVLSIKDNGIGIDARHQLKLFDKFYRVPTGNKHTVKGYGLGLFYVKEMIENHGGSIEVVSKPGKGTEFIIKMPQQWKK